MCHNVLAVKELKTRTRARLDSQGRFVIPAAIRKELDIRPGEAVVLKVQDGELLISSIRAGIRRAQAIAAKYTKERDRPS